jgi:hypothetical protein
MLEHQRIVSALKASRIDNASEPIPDPDVASRYFVFIQIQRDKEGRQNPTNKLLGDLHRQLSDQHIDVQFILSEADQDDVLATIKTVVFRAFPDAIRNVFIGHEGNKITVWIEPKHAGLAIEDDLQKTVHDTLKLMGYHASKINFTTSEEYSLPTPTAVLRTLRIMAPASVEALKAELTRKGFSVPDERWLNHLLDRLRKAGKVVRQRNGELILTLEGLSALGTSKNKKSADVARALDLGTRRR